MSAALRPRELVHRGAVEARGMIVSTELLGEAAARARVLAMWEPGVSVEEIPGALFVLFASSKWIACNAAPGVPVVEKDGVLYAAPLDAGERKRLGAPRGALVRVTAGVANIESRRSTADVAAWLDVTHFELATVEPLGRTKQLALAAPPVAITPASFSVGEPAAERADVVAALEAAKRGGNPAKTGGAGFGGFWRELLHRMGSAFAKRSSTSGGPASEGEGLFASLRRNFVELAAWLAQAVKLSRVLGWRQAEYLSRMIDMFQNGDFDAALRHAIPLGGTSGGKPAAPMLGTPSPRRDLTISQRTTGATSVLTLQDELFAGLRKIYLQSADRLERAGRIQEAAFVLAELLHDASSAVALLEKHGQHQLAAELAEGRGLNLGQVIRLWMLAGNVDRAVTLARRHHAFAAGVALLERTVATRAEGRTLRMLWGATLAEAGNFEHAVEVVWPIEEARPLANRWMDLAIEGGGQASMLLLARKAAFDPNSYEDVRRRMIEHCRDASPEAAPARARLLEMLVGAPDPRSRALSRLVVRAVVRDSGLGHTRIQARQMKYLHAATPDDALSADLPVLTRAPQSPSAEEQVIRVAAEDRGQLPVSDAALLPGGRILVALGEAGARLYTPDGRPVRHFDVPTHALVVSENGARALALASHGRRNHVVQLDLLQLRVGHAWEEEFNAYAPSFDGSMWAVAQRDAVAFLDMFGSRPRAVWRVGDLGGTVIRVAWAPSGLAFLVAGPEGLAHWHYEAPPLALRSRVDLDPETFPPGLPLALDGLGGAVMLDGSLEAPVLRHLAGGWSPVPVGSGTVVGSPIINDGFAAVRLRDETASIVRLLRFSDQKFEARFELAGKRGASAQFGPDGTVVIFDDTGVVITWSLTHGHLLRDLRLR